MKTEAHFRSTAFNCTEPKDYFINDCCFGDDVAKWLIEKLRFQGLKTASDPSQEDFGWHITFHVNDIEHCFIIGFQPNNPATGDQWIGWLERKVGLLGGLLGGKKRGISPEAIQSIDTALKSSSDIQHITWHEPGIS